MNSLQMIFLLLAKRSSLEKIINKLKQKIGQNLILEPLETSLLLFTDAFKHSQVCAGFNLCGLNIHLLFIFI